MQYTDIAYLFIFCQQTSLALWSDIARPPNLSLRKQTTDRQKNNFKKLLSVKINQYQPARVTNSLNPLSYLFPSSFGFEMWSCLHPRAKGDWELVSKKWSPVALQSIYKNLRCNKRAPIFQCCRNSRWRYGEAHRSLRTTVAQPCLPIFVRWALGGRERSVTVNWFGEISWCSTMTTSSFAKVDHSEIFLTPTLSTILKTSFETLNLLTRSTGPGSGQP